jgi:DNA-binding NtrC family response regulator
VQAKLLRVLETGEVQRVGSLESRCVDVRVIAATNRDLELEVEAGRFRRDLFYRLNVAEVALPPLRERREDIPYLVAAFVREFATRLQKPLAGPTAAAERLLVSAPLPGNVRELRNLVERACMLADGEFLTEQDVAPRGRGGSEAPGRAAVPPPGIRAAPPARDTNRDEILRILQTAGGNKQAAARMLGLSRRAFYRRLERFGLGEAIARRV